MTGRSAAADRWKKAVAMSLSLFGHGFNPSKCKTSAKMAVARIKLLRNKREVVIRQIRRDIAMLLESGQDATARIRVEHVIREQNIMAANELIELFCDLVVARLSIIAKQRECPPDLKEGISSLIFAGPRCSELPELLAIRDVFQKKYGKDFVSAATDLRPNAGVNRLLIEKLSVKTPSGEVKLKVLKEIAKEYQVKWDTTETEEELLKLPEERIDGPNGFVSASGMPLKPIQRQSLEPNDANRGQGNMMSFQDVASAAGVAAEKALAAAEAAAHLAACGGQQMSASSNNSSRNSNRKGMPSSRVEYSSVDRSEDRRTTKTNGYEYFNEENEQRGGDDGRKVVRRQSYDSSRNSSRKFMPNSRSEFSFIEDSEDDGTLEGNGDDHFNEENEQRANDDGRKMARRQSYDSSRRSSGKIMPDSRSSMHYEKDRTIKGNGDDYSHSNEEFEDRVNDDGRRMIRRQSYNCQRAPTDIKFDESDCDEEIEMEEPPSTKTGKFNRRHSYNVPPPRSDARYDEYSDDDNVDGDEYADEAHQPARGNTTRAPERPPPQIPARRVHPKLPDYDVLTARFEALKQHKMRPR